MTKKFFLPIEKVQKLQESVGWLDNYEPTIDEIHHIGPNINTENTIQTNLLTELGRLNSRKKFIINELMNSK